MTNNSIETTGKENRKIETDLKKFHGEAATSAMEDAGIAYQAPSLIAAGAGAQGVSLMSFFTNMVLSLLFTRAPGVAEKLGSTKKSVLVLALSSVITWLPLIVVFILFRSVNTAWMVGLWVFSLIPSTLLIPLRDGWMAGKVPARNVGRYFGRRSLIAGLAYLCTFSLMGYVLDHFFERVFQGYAIILGIAFIASIGSFFLYRKIDDAPSKTAKEKEDFRFRDFIKEMRGGSLGVFILFIALFNLTVNLASPLCAVYLLKDLKFTYLTYTMLVSIEYLARIVSVSFWGKYADRVGSLKVLGLVTRLIPVIPILWLFSGILGVSYLFFVYLFSGAVWAGFDLCSQTYIYKASPENKRMKYIGYYKSLVTLAMALGALSGAALLNVVPTVFGSGILGMFLLSGIARFLVGSLMFHKLVDLAWMPSAKSKAIFQPASNTAVQRGLFYRPEEWTLYLQETVSDEAEAAPTVVRKGMFHRLQEWADYLYKTVYLHEMMPREPAVIPAQGLFHKPEAWSNYLQEVAPVEPEVKTTSSKKGIFHQPAAWSDYRQETAPVEPAPVAVPSKGLFRKPEAWSNYLQETAPAEPEAAAVPTRQGLFRKPEAWSIYLQKTSPVAITPEVAAKPSSGLFHKPEAWSNYLQNTAPAAPGPETAAAPSRNALFRKPEAWSSYLQSTRPSEAKTKPKTGRAAQTKRRFLPVDA